MGEGSSTLDHLGQGLGFFSSYADSFWKSTGMELDLVHRDGESWHKVAGRIKGEQCRDLALSGRKSAACESCFWDTCNQALRHQGFQSSVCHAGMRFSLCSLGDCGGIELLLLAGRVRVVEERGVAADDLLEEEPCKTLVEYDAALSLLELSIPFLTSRLRAETIAENRRLSPLVRRACRHIDRHFRDKLSLSSVAEACQVSNDHLCHAFSEQTGKPLTRYLNAVRVGHAMFLLMKSEMDVTEICFEVGFQSVSQFNRAFRALQGTSPSAYRRSCEA